MLITTERRTTAVGTRPTCPVCRRPVHGVVWPVGVIFMRCESNRCPSRPRSKFRAIALPPGTTGRVLAELVGPDAALTLARKHWPATRELTDPGVLSALLVPAPTTLYLTVSLAGGEYYHELSAREQRSIVRALSAGQ